VAEKTADGPGGEGAGTGPSRLTYPSGILLEYRLEEPVSLIDAPAFGHIERWTVAVLVDHLDAADERRNIGYARVIVLNLEAGVTLADLADPASGDWVEISALETRTDTAAGIARDDESESEETSLLVLDRLWIEPDYRGNGLGPIVAACAILRLGRGCRLAACYPAPFETSRASEDRDRSIEALGRIWAKVGFTPWNDGVWMLDLRTTDLRDALERLLPHTPDERPQNAPLG
jgi:GNAT superfamily N-acetyltransferase